MLLKCCLTVVGIHTFKISQYTQSIKFRLKNNMSVKLLFVNKFNCPSVHRHDETYINHFS